MCGPCLQTVIICTNTDLPGPNYAIYFQYFQLTELRSADWAELTLLERDKFDRDLTWTVRCIDSIVSMREKNSLISYNLELSLFSDQF